MIQLNNKDNFAKLDHIARIRYFRECSHPNTRYILEKCFQILWNKDRNYQFFSCTNDTLYLNHSNNLSNSFGILHSLMSILSYIMCKYSYFSIARFSKCIQFDYSWMMKYHIYWYHNCLYWLCRLSNY